MAEINAKMVGELRERTGAGMMDCKKALVATNGDMDAAIEKMRMDGMTKADKKATRVAAEGRIAVASNGEAIALVEVNCETDFVAKADDFVALADAAAKIALTAKPATVEELVAMKNGAETLDEQRRAMVIKLGENITIRRFEVLLKAAGPIVSYLHGSKIGVVVAMEAGDETLAKDLALHAAAMSPKVLSAADVSADAIAAERKVIEGLVATEAAEAQANAEADGKVYKAKPAEIIAKMIDGKINKFTSEISLLGQPFVKNDAYGMKSDEAVEKTLKAKNAKVARFVRLAVGEGIEKKVTDYAAEVAEAARG
ncbi:MAG: translation elongation factor Ts [Stagnimonas sp.]|nr:translation elongation factor Ts [Stagnimonas sp.]